MAAEIKYRVNTSNDVWLTTDEYLWTIGWNGGSMLWVDVYANGDIKVNEHKDEDWCRYFGRDDKGDFYRYWFTFISNSGYERRNQYDFTTTVDGETVGFTLKIKQKGQLATPTVSDNLNRIIKAKSDIKQAIENKGVTVGDMTIDGYAAKINEIPQEVTGGGKWVVPNGLKFGMSNLTEIDFNNMDFSNVTDISYFFAFNEEITSIDLSFLDTSNSDSLSNMFYSCSKLTEIKGTENWDTSNLKDLSGMFQECSKLTEIKGIENWDTSNLKDLSGMFQECSNITSVDLSKWNLSKVTDMDWLFFNCKSLTEVKMGGDVSKVSYVNYMFEYITTTGTFYYNPQYDYSKIIAQLPSTWTAVPME